MHQQNLATHCWAHQRRREGRESLTIAREDRQLIRRYNSFTSAPRLCMEIIRQFRGKVVNLEHWKQTSGFVYVQDNARPHTARLLFWRNRMWRSWTGQLGSQTWAPFSMFGTKWGLGLRHGWPHFHCARLAACCPPGVVYSSTKKGEDPGGEHATSCVCSSRRQRVSHRLLIFVVTWL